MSVFKPLDVSRQEFTELISKSKLQGIGPEEPLYTEGRYSSSNFAFIFFGISTFASGRGILPFH